MNTLTTRPTFFHEQALWDKKFTVIGLDEVGRGAFAGPLVVASVVFDSSKKCSNYLAKNINDSKKLSHKKRVELTKYIQDEALFYDIVSIPVSVINRRGIGKSTYIAFRKTVANISKKIQDRHVFLLVDGFSVPYLRLLGRKNQHAIIKGDQISISIAAASILAKVYRDSLMVRLHEKHLMYDFKSNKGYGTAYHRAMIKAYGMTNLHRIAFCH